MSRNIYENKAQHFLYYQGEKRLAKMDIDHEEVSPVDVRKEGVKHLAKGALAVLAAAGAVAGGDALVVHAYDHSPTVRYHERIINEQQNKLHPDPNQATIHLTKPEQSK